MNETVAAKSEEFDVGKSSVLTRAPGWGAVSGGGAATGWASSGRCLAAVLLLRLAWKPTALRRSDASPCASSASLPEGLAALAAPRVPTIGVIEWIRSYARLRAGEGEGIGEGLKQN